MRSSRPGARAMTISESQSKYSSDARTVETKRATSSRWVKSPCTTRLEWQKSLPAQDVGQHRPYLRANRRVREPEPCDIRRHVQRHAELMADGVGHDDARCPRNRFRTDVMWMTRQ